MRLIDVDKFEKENSKCWKMNDKNEHYYSVDYILNQAMVEAIPIEKIECLIIEDISEIVPTTIYRNGTPIDAYSCGWNDCINEILKMWGKLNDN